jgi:hypothetical protein
MKYLPLYLLLAAAAMLVASLVQPGSGWGVGAVAFASIGGITAGVNKYRTGKWLTNSAGGR